MTEWEDRRVDRTRRAFVRRWIELAPAAALAVPASAADTQAAALDALPQPPAADAAQWMGRAFAMRRHALASGDQPYGAVVVKDGRIVGQSPSRVVVNQDPSGHAEMEAIRDAARRLASRDLSGCELYSSSRPCPMCEAAAYWAGIERLWYGAGIADGGPPRLTRC